MLLNHNIIIILLFILAYYYYLYFYYYLKLLFIIINLNLPRVHTLEPFRGGMYRKSAIFFNVIINSLIHSNHTCSKHSIPDEVSVNRIVVSLVEDTD